MSQATGVPLRQVGVSRSVVLVAFAANDNDPPDPPPAVSCRVSNSAPWRSPQQARAETGRDLPPANLAHLPKRGLRNVVHSARKTTDFEDRSMLLRMLCV